MGKCVTVHGKGADSVNDLVTGFVNQVTSGVVLVFYNRYVIDNWTIGPVLLYDVIKKNFRLRRQKGTPFASSISPQLKGG